LIVICRLANKSAPGAIRDIEEW
jgi:hypothetical protein